MDAGFHVGASENIEVIFEIKGCSASSASGYPQALGLVISLIEARLQGEEVASPMSPTSADAAQWLGARVVSFLRFVHKRSQICLEDQSHD